MLSDRTMESVMEELRARVPGSDNAEELIDHVKDDPVFLEGLEDILEYPLEVGNDNHLTEHGIDMLLAYIHGFTSGELSMHKRMAEMLKVKMNEVS